MRDDIRNIIHKVAVYLELAVAVVITVMIAISIVNMVIHIASNPMEIQDSDRFYEFMNDALSLIVGIEFLQMIIIPTADNVVETLLFAVSRHVILDHGLGVMIVGIICIVLLFFVKKYLFTDFEKQKTRTFRGKTPLNRIRSSLGIVLNTDEDKTLGEFIARKFLEENKKVKKGESIVVDGIRFKIEKINKKGEIKRISASEEED